MSNTKVRKTPYSIQLDIDKSPISTEHSKADEQVVQRISGLLEEGYSLQEIPSDLTPIEMVIAENPNMSKILKQQLLDIQTNTRQALNNIIPGLNLKI